MKLISCTDYVLSGAWDNPVFTVENKLNVLKIINYANFLKRPLELGMFIPCDLEGNVLEEPEQKFHHMGKDSKTDMMVYSHQSLQYQEAKDRLLFDCPWFNKKSLYWNMESKSICCWLTDEYFETIEDLANNGFDLTLTQTDINSLNK